MKVSEWKKFRGRFLRYGRVNVGIDEYDLSLILKVYGR